MSRFTFTSACAALMLAANMHGVSQTPTIEPPSYSVRLPPGNGDRAMDAFIVNFYVDDGNGTGHYSSRPANTIIGASNIAASAPALPNGCNAGTVDRSGTAPASFWNQAEEIEATEDAAQRNPIYVPLVISLLDGFVKINTQTWTDVTCYNDDIMWATLAFLRGYKLTGRQQYLSLAQSNFDAAYARGYDSSIMAMRWNVFLPTLNAITNETASLASALLARELPYDNNYQAKSLTLFNYVLRHFYQPDGAVIGAVGQGPTTYNEGVFIEAAYLNSQPSEAAKAANYLSTVAGQTVPGSGAFHILNNYAGDQNNLGFNSIALRWLHRYAVESGTLFDYAPWIRANATAAYSVRNTEGNSWQDWLPLAPPTTTSSSDMGQKLEGKSSQDRLAVTPPDSLLLSWDCVSGVTVAQVSENSWW